MSNVMVKHLPKTYSDHHPILSTVNQRALEGKGTGGLGWNWDGLRGRNFKVLSQRFGRIIQIIFLRLLPTLRLEFLGDIRRSMESAF